MTIHPLAGKPAPASMLVNLDKLLEAYHREVLIRGRHSVWPSGLLDIVAHPSSDPLTVITFSRSSKRSVSTGNAKGPPDRCSLA